jgi:acetyl-CoA acetyltransferase
VITSRNPMKDKVAIVAASTTGYTPHNTPRSQASYAAQACTDVIRKAGLTAADINGVCGSSPSASYVQAMLGIPEVTWFNNLPIPFVNQMATASAVVAAGLADTVLVYHSPYRLPWNTASSLRDPFRRPAGMGGGGGGGPGPETMAGAVGYTAWASRYLYEHKHASKEDFGLIAINDRSNAARNPGAAMREPLSMEQYLAARMIRWPLCLLDMDVPVDGADAFIVTTAERARDMALPPVLINAAVLGAVDHNEEDQNPSLARHGQQVVVDTLKAKADFWVDDMDIFFPYDGFSFITLSWIENTGLCGPGEAGDYLRQNWDAENNRILLRGKVPVNPHGGALSEGGSQGSGHVREAVHQLQGLAGDRQVPGASTALVTAGGFFFNAQGLALRKG